MQLIKQEIKRILMSFESGIYMPETVWKENIHKNPFSHRQKRIVRDF